MTITRCTSYLTGGGVPTLGDRSKLPYCDATIMEIQRLACVAPGSIPHVANEDGYLAGYKIPKGTILLYNIYKFHMDRDYWKDPETFNPDRFLDGKKEQFIPYGMGKRVCMGESLARNELFIFSSLILQNFKIELPTCHEKPDPQKDDLGVTRVPKPFYVKISLRE